MKIKNNQGRWAIKPQIPTANVDETKVKEEFSKFVEGREKKSPELGPFHKLNQHFVQEQFFIKFGLPHEITLLLIHLFGFLHLEYDF